ncbi:MAG: hypothetical protein ACPW61_05255 [Methyloligella sp. ZOD6]
MAENTLAEVQDDGLLLLTLDGSTWRVSVGENTRSILWLPTDPVLIEKLKDDSYRITRLADRDSVLAWPED